MQDTRTFCEHCGAACDANATICFECGAPLGAAPLATGPLPVPEHLKAPVTVELPAVPRSAAPTLDAQWVRCPACGAPLDPDATICFECGAAIGDDSVSTGPLHVPDHLRAPITIELPVIIWTERARAAHALTPPNAPRGGFGVKWSRRPITRRDVIVSGIILLVALLLVGAGIEVLVQYRVAPPAISAQTIYRDPEHRFHFVQPTLWQATTNAEGVRLADTTGTSTLDITAVPAWGLDPVAQADALAAADGLGTLPPIPFAGESWEQRAGQVQDTRGVRREIVALVTVHDGTLFTITYSSPVSSFSDLTLLVYQPVLQSFAFDSPVTTPSPGPSRSATPGA